MIENIKKINFDVSSNNSFYHPAGTFYIPSPKTNKKFKFDIKDNAIFSPAAEYLNNFKLQLNNLIIRDDKRLLIELNFDNYYFFTEIFFELFFYTSRKNYLVVANSLIDPFSTYEISIAVKKTKILKNYKEIDKPNFNFLKKFIQQIDDLNIYESISRFDSPTIQTLIENIETDFYNEMIKVNKIIYSLIQHLGLLELKQDYEFPKDNFPNILLDKITKIKNSNNNK
ncbi:MAG TPA: hypothetical protein PK887_08980 [Ignavibacteriales bacterium]|jgi:hypothetical protein|nr:hypothetical protein [Ignavibacteriales bacterium]